MNGDSKGSSEKLPSRLTTAVVDGESDAWCVR
jgi:hypothetical protein